MVKVKVVVPLFNDLECNVLRKQGEVYETTEERAKFLVGPNPMKTKVVEIIEVQKEQPKEEKAENKKTTKKVKKFDIKKK